MIRIALFLITNLAVMVVFGIILFLIGTSYSSTIKLAITAGLFGFIGSLLSLLMSKFIALSSIKGEVIKNPCNDTQRWLMNIVRIQSEKVGIIAPKIAIYHAFDMNAFATGARKNSSLIAVSTGLLKNMNYDEIEAVIAHEISHISNGDMITMTLLQGIVNTFVIFISRILAKQIANLIAYSDRNVEERIDGNPLTYFFISTVLELIFGILASMISLWFSRNREFHADAGSAILVGRKKMIAALQKLKTSSFPEEPNSIIAFCIHGRTKSFSTLFMSHPPIDKRIEALKSGIYLNYSKTLED